MSTGQRQRQRQVKRNQVDPDLLVAWRNWLLLKADSERVKRGEPRDRIGQSCALRNQLDLAETDRQAKEQGGANFARQSAGFGQLPRSPRDSFVSNDDDDPGSIYTFTREGQLANEEMGYGETIRDDMWQLGEKSGRSCLEQETRYSRRTKTGRQVLTENEVRSEPVAIKTK
jgi:hypothetical protein